MIKLDRQINYFFLAIFFLLSFTVLSCKNEINKKKEKKNFYNIKHAQISDNTQHLIESYISKVNIKKSNKNPVIICKYHNNHNENYMLIYQHERHAYFFYDKGFLKNTFCIGNESIPILLVVDKELINTVDKYSISFKDEDCILKFPNAALYSFLTPDSIIPNTVKENIKKDENEWVSHHFSGERWLFQISKKGDIINESLKIFESGEPIIY